MTIQTMRAKLANLFAVTAIAALTACGGGGSSPAPVSSTPAPAPTPAAPTVTNPDLVTSVSAPTYSAGTVEKGAWDLLMSQRKACGFGLIQQDSRLDVAAAAHTYYLAQNSIDKMVTVVGHYEDPTWSYFVGNNPLDRAIHAGYLATGISEILNNDALFYPVAQAAPLALNETTGASQMRGLLETVYHAQGAFNAGRTGGVGSSSETGPTSSAAYSQQQFRLVADFSIDSNPQKLGTGNLASWPCAGLTGVRGKFVPTTESPNPFPDVTDTTVTYGTPIYLKVDAGSTLVVSTATVTKVSDGSALVLRQLNSSNDPNAEIGTNEVFLVPTTALAAGSSYAVSTTGTLNGTAFSKTFTFATAP